MLVTKELVLTTEFNGVLSSDQREVLVDLRNGAYIALVVACTSNAGIRVRAVINDGAETDVGERSIAGIRNTHDLVPTLAERIVAVALGIPLKACCYVHQRCRRDRKVVVEVVEVVFLY